MENQPSHYTYKAGHVAAMCAVCAMAVTISLPMNQKLRLLKFIVRVKCKVIALHLSNYC